MKGEQAAHQSAGPSEAQGHGGQDGAWFTPVGSPTIAWSRAAEVMSALLVVWLPVFVALLVLRRPWACWAYAAVCLLGALAIEAVRLAMLVSRSKRMRLVLDEGGVRACIEGRSVYRPLEELVYCCLRQRQENVTETLVIRGRHEELTIELPEHAPEIRERACAFMRAVNCARIERTTRAARVLQRPAEMALDGWTREMDGALDVARGTVYRGVMMDRWSLRSAVNDPKCAAETRAAAAYLLVRQGELEPVRSAMASRCCPPLLVVLARLAGGRALVGDSLLGQMLPWLAPKDRLGASNKLATSARRPTPGAPARHRSVLEAQRQAIALKSLTA